MAEIVRTFIAVEIPAEVKERAGRLIGRLSVGPAKVKWVAPAAMHWTLKFLGDVNILETPQICEAVARAVGPLAPFDIEAWGAGAFPDTSRPRTVWIGMRRGADEMIAVHDRIEAELAELGYRGDGRRFRPHLTIGRVRASREGIDELGRLIGEHADFEGGVSAALEVVVFSSMLGREGPTHQPLGHAVLTGQ